MPIPRPRPRRPHRRPQRTRRGARGRTRHPRPGRAPAGAEGGGRPRGAPVDRRDRNGGRRHQRRPRPGRQRRRRGPRLRRGRLAGLRPGLPVDRRSDATPLVRRTRPRDRVGDPTEPRLVVRLQQSRSDRRRRRLAQPGDRRRADGRQQWARHRQLAEAARRFGR